MKNKIIFKTLMLKGEPGSTIVSMEKTGHVGTADIYTITFNDGSTKEISLENMSAITSVEKTSSTNTEDIYTITCADGSTQTFSVLNHNADIAEMSDDIDVMSARLANFLATQTGVSNGTLRTETTLFSSTVPSMGNDENNSGYFDLEDSVDNYDEIVIRYSTFSGKSAVVTIKPDDIPVADVSGSPLHWSEIEPNNQITVDAQNGDRSVHRFMSFTAYKFTDVDRISIDAFVWGWNGSANSNGVVSSSFTETWNSTNGAWQTSGFIGGIYSITGIKYEEAGTSKDPELADLRVGADGTVYNSAGDAMRGQVTALEGQIGAAGNNLAAEYDATQTYVIGDYCVKDGVLYVCTTVISTAEAWTAEHWTAVKVMSEMTAGIGELDDQIQDLREDLNTKTLKYNGLATGTKLDASTNQKTGWYTIRSADLSSFTDTPTGAGVGSILNLSYTGSNNVAVIRQFYFNAFDGKIWSRLISGGSAYNTWEKVSGENIEYTCMHYGAVNPTTYSNKLTNITNPLTFGISDSSAWEDLPVQAVGIVVNIKYQSNFMVQMFYKYPTLEAYGRIINTSDHTAVSSWTRLSAGDYETVWYALGDSITAGSYSTDDGIGVAVTDAEWSYPRRIERNRCCVVHNLGVPGRALTEMMTQANQVASDATLVTITGGANDYYGKEKPLGTHTSAVDNNTVCGAIRNLIETIATTAPNARIVLISPLIIKYGTSATKWSMNYAVSNKGNFTYAELADAMKQIAEDYNIEFVDGTRNGPVNVLNIGSVEKDNVHPTIAFYNAYANWVESKLF